MRKWLCGKGLHAWDTLIEIRESGFVVSRRCARKGCNAQQGPAAWWPPK